MSKRNNYISAVLALPVIAMAFPGSINAQDEEVDKAKQIREIVIEAKAEAKMWADKVREMVGSEDQKTTYIGVVIESVPSVLRDYIDLPEGVGLLLPRITKDGPADKAGLKDNDILVEFDGQLIVNYNQLSTLIGMKKPGDTVPVKILRKGEQMEFEITLEERVRKGMRFLHPPAPDSPDAPPLPPGVGGVMQQIDEWIPGSVRVFIDENEQVHVDLRDLKNDLQGLRKEIKNIHIIDGSSEEDIVMKHGDEGARTTTIHIADKNLNYVSDEGRVELYSVGNQRYARVWDENDEILFEGPLPENYPEKLPEKAVKLIDDLESIQLDSIDKKIKVEMHTDDVDPVTMVIESN